MSDDRKLPMPNLLDKANLLAKFREGWLKRNLNHSLAPSPQPSRSTTPAPFNRQGPALDETAGLPSDAESALRCADNGEDALKGDTAKSDNSDAIHLPGGPVDGPSRIIMQVSGGTGGSGGWGGQYGGHGGTGEGPKFDFRHSNINHIDPHATKLQFIKEKLAGHIAAQHKFTDQSKSLCAPGTRVDIQADINQWLSLGSSTKELIFWVTGIAGSGKSTLSATIVENLRKKCTPVAAQFFISRNILETTDPNKIIPTIAQQLSAFSPAAAHIIHDALKHGFISPRKEQVEKLLLDPIRAICQSCDMVIILIDALDELQNAADTVLEMLLPIAGSDLPNNVRFIITSRPEHWADISGSKKFKPTVFKWHSLETESSVHEVHNFIFVRMKQITHWNDWPNDDEVQKLSDKANGLFHYAATALQWIEEQIRKTGTASRKRVFERFTQMGIGQLEDLYRLILTSFEDIDGPAQDADWRASQLRGFQHVIGTILVLDEPLTIRQIIALLADIPEDDFDVGHFLRQMRSVLIPGTAISYEEATPQMHKSFRDYIMDGHAPAEFCILTGHAHFIAARSCLEVIVKAGSQSDIVVKYSVKHWYKHLRKAEESITWEDGRMENLFEQMMEEAVVDVWKAESWGVFLNMAAVGWGLLKQHADKNKMQGISNILIKAKNEDLRAEEEEDEEEEDEEEEDVWEDLDEEEEEEDEEYELEEEEEDDELGPRFPRPQPRLLGLGLGGLEEEEEEEEEDEEENLQLGGLELEERLSELGGEGIPYRKIWTEGLLETWDSR